tara:strand:+ start:435 stop:644 length:210 start_codon:yes stop_codon:yes gene_type:complete
MYLIPTLFSSLYLLGAINWYMMHKAVLYLVEVEHNDTHILFKATVWPLFVIETILYNLFAYDDDEEDEE